MRMQHLWRILYTMLSSAAVRRLALFGINWYWGQSLRFWWMLFTLWKRTPWHTDPWSRSRSRLGKKHWHWFWRWRECECVGVWACMCGRVGVFSDPFGIFLKEEWKRSKSVGGSAYSLCTRCRYSSPVWTWGCGASLFSPMGLLTEWAQPRFGWSYDSCICVGSASSIGVSVWSFMSFTCNRRRGGRGFETSATWSVGVRRSKRQRDQTSANFGRFSGFNFFQFKSTAVQTSSGIRGTLGRLQFTN